MLPLTWLQVVVSISHENRYSDEVYFLKRIRVQDRGQPSQQAIRGKFESGRILWNMQSTVSSPNKVSFTVKQAVL